MKIRMVKGLVCAMIFSLACGVATTVYPSAVQADTVESTVVLPDYSAGEGRTLDGLIVKDIVTFEARIKLSTDGTANSSGNCYGVIFGNYSEKNTACALNYEVREGGCPAVLFGETYYTFDTVNVRTGEWVDLAITIDRDNGEMTAFVDGEEKQTLTELTLGRSLVYADKFSVGRDTRTTGNYADTFFMGEIARVAAFSDVRTAEELLADVNGAPEYAQDNALIYKESYAIEGEESIVRGNKTYEASEAFKKVPNSFEAWINVPEDLPDSSYGGVIFGNSRGITNEELGVINYEVGQYGHLLLRWNKRQLEYEFRSADLRTGDWTHIAVVRDESDHSFSYYVNGELCESFVYAADSSVSGYSYGICSDFSNGKGEVKTPLYGEVKQVTVYADAIDEQRVKEDMQATEIYGGNGYDLLANWYFGDGSDSVVYDTSVYANDMQKGTVDTFADTFSTVNEEFAYDYSFVVLPDTQNMVDADYNGYDNLLAISNWVKDNKDSQKIQFAMHLGDFVNTPQKNGGENTTEWKNAYDAMQILNGVLPYSVIPGNHDYDNMQVNRDLTIFNKYFGVDTYNPMGTEIHYYESGKMDNTYHTFTVGNVKYLVFALEFGARTDVLNWASEVATRHADYRIIVTTHAFVTEHGVYDQNTGAAPRTYGFVQAGDADYVNNGKAIWDKFISKHSNIFMVLNGHYASDNIIRKTYYGNAGNTVNAMFINAQSVLACNEGMVALLKVNESTKEICVNYYNPARGKYYNEQNQFVFSFADTKNPTVQGEQVATHTVKFETNGGNEYREWQIEAGESISLKTPVKVGFTFGGWFTDKGLTEEVTSDTLTVTKDVTLYAKWDKIDALHTVTFHTDGGSEIAVRSLETGALIIRPNDPVKSGFRFDGWYKNAQWTEAWSFSTDRITDDVTLYAKWTEVKNEAEEEKPENSSSESSEEGGESSDSGCNSAIGIVGATTAYLVAFSVAWVLKKRKS